MTQGGDELSEQARAPEESVRTERILPGVWRIRLPLPWPGVPHVNAFAVAGQGGVVLFDTGMDSPGGMRQLESGLAQAGFALGDVRLLVCTHAHTDHYGLAARVVEAVGCELWMHPAWEHIRAMAEDPDGALERRIEVARQSGVPAAALASYEESRRGGGSGIARAIGPDRELVEGTGVRTDLGGWEVHETPGHAPSHVVLHQPERRLLISGDQLLGRVSIFYDYGHTPDPVGEYETSLEAVDRLGVDLCLAGHGKPFRQIPAKVEANRALIREQRGRVRDGLGAEPRNAFELVGDLVGPERMNAAAAAWGLQVVLAYLDNLVIRGEAEAVVEGDTKRWRSADRAGTQA